MYEIHISEKADKQLRKLERDMQDRILRTLERIRVRPHAYVTRLVGETFYKFRIGDYRLFLDIDNGKLVILVIELGHRKNIYD